MKFSIPIIVIISVVFVIKGFSFHNTKHHLKCSDISFDVIDTIPLQSKQSFKIMRKDGDRELEMSFEDGEVTDLSINGKKIEKKDYSQYQDLIDENKPHSKDNGTMFFFGDGGDGFAHIDMRMMVDSMMRGFNRDFSFDEFHFEDSLDALRESMRQFHLFDDGNFNFNFDLDSIQDFGEKMKKHGFEFKGDLDRDFEYNDSEFDSTLAEREHSITEIIGNNLNKDGLLIPGQTNQIELSGKFLKINGEKQPTNIWQKYMRLFEESAGSALDRSSKLKFSFEGKESKRKFRVY